MSNDPFGEHNPWTDREPEEGPSLRQVRDAAMRFWDACLVAGRINAQYYSQRIAEIHESYRRLKGQKP